MIEPSEVSEDRGPAHWTRRAWIGGGVLIAAAAAAGAWRAAETGVILQDEEAFEPWAAWRATPVGDPMSLVAAAVLAASPHNTQPWRFRVHSDGIEVRADDTRSLGALDPFGREMWHGLGAAIANAEIAATVRGFGAQTAWLPEESDASLAARIALVRQPSVPSPLAAFIDQRRTHRAAYDPERPVPASVREIVSAADDDDVRIVWLDAQSEPGRRFAEATLAATRQISADAEMSRDGHHWFRASPKQVARHRDGVSARTAGISPLVATLSPLAPPLDSQTAAEYWLRSTEMQLTTAPLYGLIVVRDLYSRRTQLLAGARWQRTHLRLTAAGMAAHPLNQLIEIVDRDRQLGRPSPSQHLLARLTGDRAWRPTFAFRVGYAGTVVPRSPRRPVASVVIV